MIALIAMQNTNLFIDASPLVKAITHVKKKLAVSWIANLFIAYHFPALVAAN